jgi:hypothetical protein
VKKLTPSSIQTDHFTSHSALLPVYESLFAPIKDTSNSILEIGTNDGGGLQMYADYFPLAPTYGMDILPTPKEVLDSKNIRQHFQRNAYTVESVKLMKGFAPFALIVDDGSHTLEHQIWFCKNYPALLASDGIAIVEDIQDEKFLKSLLDAVPQGYCSMAIDMRHKNGRFDDLILVIWKTS